VIPKATVRFSKSMSQLLTSTLRLDREELIPV
jgi:hypothetical protein